MRRPPSILCPIASGSGAIVICRELERHLDDYRVRPFDSRRFRHYLPSRSIRSAPVDIVHGTPDDAVLFAGRHHKLVVTFHNYVLDRSMRPFSSAAQRAYHRTWLRLATLAALRRADAVTAVSRFTADLVRRDTGFEGEIQLIENGVDTQVFHPPRRRELRDEVRVLFSGNLSRRKGADLLPALAERLPSHVVLSVAQGSRGIPRRLRRAAGLFELLGNVPQQEMADMYRKVDVLVMPTVREGFSLSVLEAMASGLPVVGSRCSSLPEQVVHGEGGYLCAVGDVDDFATRITRLANDPNLRMGMGAFNRRRALECFPLARMVEGYRRLFEAVEAA